MENLLRWTVEGCELASDLHHSAPCAAPHLIDNGGKLKTRSSLLIVTSVVSIVVRLWVERKEH